MKNQLIDLNLMYIFVTVAEQKSITKAARAIGLTKQTVSRKIIDLETALDIQLITRTTRYFKLTKSGEDYYRNCSRIVADAQLANAAIKKSGELGEQSIKIVISQFLGRSFINSVLSALLDADSNMNFEVLVTEKTGDLDLDDIDIVIGVGASNDSLAVTKDLGFIDQLLVCSPEYSDRIGHSFESGKADHLTYIGLSGSDLFLPQNTCSYTAQWLIVDDITTAKDVAINGGGVAGLPYVLCVDELANKSLVNLTSSIELGKKLVTLSCRKSRMVSTIIKRNISIIVDVYNNIIKPFEGGKSVDTLDERRSSLGM